MTARQRRFVEEYLVDLNATQACIRAGYSAKNADKIGPELLGKTRVAEAVRAAMVARSARTGIKADQVVSEYARIAFANMRDFAVWDADGVRFKPLDQLTPEQTAAIARIGQRPGAYRPLLWLQLHDKLHALDALARHLGMFVKRHTVEAALEGPPTKVNIILGPPPEELAEFHGEGDDVLRLHHGAQLVAQDRFKPEATVV